MSKNVNYLLYDIIKNKFKICFSYSNFFFKAHNRYKYSKSQNDNQINNNDVQITVS